MITGGIAVALGGWLLAIVATAACTRSWPPAPAPASALMGAEPPAVVSLLARRLSHTGYPATLLDLAARGLFGITETGPGQIMCQVCPVGSQTAMTTYEDMVLRHLAARSDASGIAPGAALGSGFAAGEKEFREQFSAEVRADATRRGLIRRRISGGTLAILAAAGLPAVALAAAGLWPHTRAGLIMLPFGYLGLMAYPWALYNGYRLTAEGRGVLAQWLGFRAAVTGGRSRITAGTALLAAGGDRRIAYAAALGAAPDAAGVFAADEKRPWSSYGGSWHRVRVGQPDERFVPHPLMLVYCVFWCCVFAAMDLVIEHTAGMRWGAVFALFPGVIAWGPTVWTFWSWSRARQLPLAAEFDGQVLQKWTDTRSTGGEDSTTYPIWCIAIDDGERDEAWSLIISQAQYEAINAGAFVHVRVDPRHNRLLALRPAA